MKNITNPKWLFIVNTLPIITLFILYTGQLNIIKSLLTGKSLRYWLIFGIILGVMGIANLLYGVFLVIKKKNIHIIYPFAAFLCYIPFIYYLNRNIDNIIPFFDIPVWMIDEKFYLYAATFLMPTLAYSLLIIVSYFTSRDRQYKAWINFLIAICIPVFVYLLFNFFLLFGKFNNLNFYYSGIMQDINIFILIILVIIFLFFFIRTFYILVTRKEETLKKYQLVWKIPVSFVFPILGLLINNGVIIFNQASSGVFGDFSNLWFYILAVLNGVFLCLPDFDNKIYRLILFAARSITFPFTFYFFIVFLPYLPFSAAAILIFGAGILMLTPLALTIIHVKEIHKDYKYLINNFKRDTIKFILVFAFFLIPLCITITYMNDKSVLFKTLDYLYAPDYSKNYSINKNSLRKTLNAVEFHANGRNNFFSSQTPYLTSYFNKIVFNNLTLSDEKINLIDRVFFNAHAVRMFTDDVKNPSVEITQITSDTVYNSLENIYKSIIHLEITNNSNLDLTEYITQINLPQGCWISDYYLYVEDRKEHGILSEKRAAMWIYNNIRIVNRDPGILHYIKGSNISFRVFPFLADETRKTGIEFIHITPVTLTIDDHSVQLGAPSGTQLISTEMSEYAFISAYGKKSSSNNIRSVKRKPYLHFLVDVSTAKDEKEADFIHRIEKAAKTHEDLLENARISFVNSYVNTYFFDEDWKNQYNSQNFDGGFFLERAVEKALFESFNKEAYPVIVVVTDEIYNAIMEKDFTDFRFTFPESDLFFNLDMDGKLIPHSLINNPKEKLSASLVFTFDQTVLEYKFDDTQIAYLPNNDEDSIVLKNSNFDIDTVYWIDNFNRTYTPREQNETALMLQAKHMSGVLHPHAARKDYFNLVKLSFLSKIMTPLTSYIVLENEAQKKVLLKKQEQVLAGEKMLDIDNSAQRMSEPSFWIFLTLICLFLGYRKYRLFRAVGKNPVE